MHHRIIKASTILVVLLSCTTTAQSAIIAAWDVDGVDVADGTLIDTGVSPYTFSATTELNAFVNGELSLGSGVTPSTTGNRYGFKVSGANTQTTLAGAIAEEHYFQFAITVDSGFALNLTSIDLDAQSTSTGSDDGAFFTSIAGFSAGNEIAAVTGVSGNTGGFDSDASGFGAIDLSAAAYQNLTGTVTFRVYGYNTTSGAGATYIRNLTGNDLVVNGALVAVPEPSAVFSLMVVGLGSMITRRRKKSPIRS